MLDPSDYRRSIRRSNLSPGYARARRPQIAWGFVAFWAVYLGALGYGLLRLYDYVTGKLHVG